MPTTEGRILSIESKTGKNANTGRDWEKIGVHLQDSKTGSEEIFFGFLPEWKRFMGKEGTYWEMLWDYDPKYQTQKNIKGGSQKPMPKESELEGLDKPKMPDKDSWIIKQNIHTAACMIVAARIQGKLLTVPDYAACKSEIDAYYLDGLKRIGYEG